MTLVLLNRGGRPLRVETLAPFAESGCAELLVILGPQPHYQIEQLATTLPRTRFVLLERERTIGEQINIGVREARTDYVFTLYTDLNPPQMSERVETRLDELNALCVVPLLRTERNEAVPSVIAPAFYRSLFRTIPVAAGADQALTLYVYGDVGVFQKGRFERLGGYDPAIANPYWQRLDFGFRAYLWGETIAVLPILRVQASRALPIDDTTPDRSYARFHLRNLSVRFVRDQGRLPLRNFFSFLLRSGLGVSDAIREFRDARSWVDQNKYRFMQDARRVTELWEVAE